ncbi:MAG TPA: hypothetical protein VNI54_12975 [Thermoanaerobaculia bacterium]|nr:hypothetical protein [Thermoanaerobaculia bacterium]
MPRLVVLALGLSIVLSQAAEAATRKWTGAGGDSAWDTPSNWENGILPVDGDSLHFPAGLAAPLLNDTSLSFIDHLWIDDGYQLNGNPIEIRDGITIAPTVSAYVGLEVRVAQSQHWTGAKLGGSDPGGTSSLNVVFTDASAVLSVSAAGTWYLFVQGAGEVSLINGVLWRHTNGSTYLYVMNGFQYVPVPMESLDPTWQAIP